MRHRPPCLRSEQGACVDGVAMEENADVSNELYRKTSISAIGQWKNCTTLKGH